MKRKVLTALALFLLLADVAAAAPRQLKPGFNLFSKEQDIQLGKEAAAQMEKEMTIVSQPELNNYIQRIGEKLAATPEAGDFPYSFKMVSDKSINAFALPGGPTFIHTGLLAAADNEAQVAGVIAHEISHVALRHGTNQVSKANLIQLPLILAGSAVGRSDSLLGNLAQLGIGLGANSLLLKFSRNAERDADLLGTRMMARVGYNPVEMARFFEKLEAGGGGPGLQFFSSHPNPGNRVKAVETEIRLLPGRTYTTGDPAGFGKMQKLVAALPPPPPRAGQSAGSAQPVPEITPSARYREHRSNSYAISYPDNWEVMAGKQSEAVTIAPKEGLVQSGSGTAIGLGMVAGFHGTGGAADLRRNTEDLIRQLTSSNPGMKVQASRDTWVDGQPALLVTLHSQSPFADDTEVDSLLSVQRPQGLFYVVLIAPQSAVGKTQGAFDAIIRSIRFPR